MGKLEPTSQAQFGGHGGQCWQVRGVWDPVGSSGASVGSNTMVAFGSVAFLTL